MWHDIRRVVEVVDSTPWSLIFVLEDGTTAQPVDRAYLDDSDHVLGGETSLTRYGLELTISNGGEASPFLSPFLRSPTLPSQVGETFVEHAVLVVDGQRVVVGVLLHVLLLTWRAFLEAQRGALDRRADRRAGQPQARVCTERRQPGRDQPERRRRVLREARRRLDRYRALLEA